MGGSAFNYFALTEGNHVDRMKECSKLTDLNQIIEYVKTNDSENILQCYLDTPWGKTLKPSWAPTIEIPSANRAFITQSPDEIYNSNDAPIVDALFSFASQVFTLLITLEMK